MRCEYVFLVIGSGVHYIKISFISYSFIHSFLYMPPLLPHSSVAISDKDPLGPTVSTIKI